MAEKEQPEMITYAVPDGFPAMSTPVKPGTRYDASEISLRPATEDDLLDLANGLYQCFPDIWWSTHEAPERRPAPEERNRRLAERFRPLLTHAPDFTFLVARMKETGEFAGAAGWHHPTKPGGWAGNMWLVDVPKEHEQAWKSGFERSEEETSGLWEKVDVERWCGEWGGYERVRREEMGSEPHWYLAPYIVMHKFRGKGIGHLMMDWVLNEADEQDPPTPVYLEALPNARPVYLHLGFKAGEGPGRELVMIRRGPV